MKKTFLTTLVLLLCMSAVLAATPRSASATTADAAPMSFTDVFASSGFGAWGRVSQAIAFDWDNDGKVDLVFPRGANGAMRLFLNNGDGTFRESNADLAQLETVPVLSMCLGDVDNDGAFDAFVLTTGGQVRYYRHEGADFVDRTPVALAALQLVSQNPIVLLDQDRDGDLDLLTSCDNGASSALTLWTNNDGAFVSQLIDSSPTAVSIFDVNGDNWPDIVESRRDGTVPQRVYINNHAGGFDVGVTPPVGPAPAYYVATPIDADADGDWDYQIGAPDWNPGGPWLYVNNGAGSFAKTAQASMSVGAHYYGSIDVGDPDRDGDADYYQHIGPWTDARFFMNDGAGQFADVSSTYGLAVGGGHTGKFGLWIDYDADNDLDLLVVNEWIADGAWLFRNNTESNNWLRVSLVAAHSNRSLYGTALKVYAQGRVQIHSFDPLSHVHQSLDRSAIIGLGAASVADSVVVFWGSGDVSRLQNVAANQEITIAEAPPIPLPFADVTDNFPGLDDNGSGNSVAWIDFDNDGDLDLSVGAGANNANRLFLNRLTENGSVTFDAMANPLIENSNTTRGLGWGIFGTGDSCPDLYQGVPLAPNVLINNSCGDVTDMSSAVTAGSSDQTNGVRVVDFDNDGRLDIHELRPSAPDRLLRNLGNWQFEEMPASALSIVDGSFDAAWADVDNDGDQDVYVTREAPWPNVLLRNDGNGAFVDVTPALLGLTDRSQGATWGDYDNDGDLDLFVTNWLAGDRLFRSDGGFSFTDVSVPGMAEARRGQSAVWGDLNNDGWLDLYVANQGDPNQMWLNVSGVAGRTFADATPAIAAALGNSTGMGLADYDQDGDLDIYVGAHLGPNTLLRNELATGAHWLEVDLDATLSNASAVGARVRVVAGAQSMVREVGANNGMWSQEPGLQHFGLGGAAFADSIVIRWPSGVVQQLVNVPADARMTITEPLDLPPGEILFADNFDAGPSASWIAPAGGWQAESQHYQNTNTSGFADSSFPLFYGSPSLANYSVQLDYVPTQASAQGVVLNLLINMSQPAIPWPYAGTTGYNIGFGYYDSFGIAKYDGSGTGAGTYLVEVASDQRIHLNVGHTYVIVFAAEFGTLKFKVYEKGTTDPGWMYTVDDATYGSGYFGLFTWNSLGWIDNVVVRGATEFNATVADVPNDQGGHLAVSWNRHLFDRVAAAIPVTEYAVQRFSGTWQNVAAVAATEADAYSVTVTTPNILTIGQPASYSHYRVLVKTANPAVYFASTPDSAYSIDNVAPPKPAAVLVDDLNFRYVTWANPGIADLATACVYRGTSAGFTPDTPVGCPGDFYNELDLDWYFYRVQFTDTHGNVSEFSDELHGQWPTPVPGAVPAALRLYPCQPNPFNPRTTIKFDLPAAGAVRLAVFDLAGRLVRTLVGEQMAPGNHEVLWDGRDGSGREVGSGTYLARLDFGGKVQTIRMGLVR